MIHYLVILGGGVTEFSNKKAAEAAYEEGSPFAGQEAWLVQGNFSRTNWYEETLYVPYGPIWVLRANRYSADLDRVRNAFMAQGTEIGIYFDLRPLKKGRLYPPPLDVRIKPSRGFEIWSPYEEDYVWLGPVEKTVAVEEYSRRNHDGNDQLRHYDGYGNSEGIFRG